MAAATAPRANWQQFWLLKAGHVDDLASKAFADFIGANKVFAAADEIKLTEPLPNVGDGDPNTTAFGETGDTYKQEVAGQTEPTELTLTAKFDLAQAHQLAATGTKYTVGCLKGASNVAAAKASIWVANVTIASNQNPSGGLDDVDLMVTKLAIQDRTGWLSAA